MSANSSARPETPGIAALARACRWMSTDPAGVLDLAQRERVDLDRRRTGGSARTAASPICSGPGGAPIVGPSARGAALEWSKAFAKGFMHRHRHPDRAVRRLRRNATQRWRPSRAPSSGFRW